MIIWTMQPLTALEQIRDTGVFRCDPDRSFNLSKPNSLKPSYAWLVERMRERIGPEPEGVVSPIWAWHTWDFERRSPDPDSPAFLRRSEPRVLLTLDIPENAVVLTDFDAWQNVMMHMIVPNTPTRADYEELVEKINDLSGDDFEAEIRRSWENVFLIDPVNNQYLVRGRYIQATFWEIRGEYIQEQMVLPPNE